HPDKANPARIAAAATIAVRTSMFRFVPIRVSPTVLNTACEKKLDTWAVGFGITRNYSGAKFQSAGGNESGQKVGAGLLNSNATAVFSVGSVPVRTTLAPSS